MVASPLPDREHRHLLQFYVMPKLDYGMRLISAGLLLLAGFGVQLLLPTDSVVTLLIGSLPLLLLGNILLLVRGFNLRPTQRLTGGSWEKTTRDRFTKLRELERDVKQWDESFTDLTCVSGVFALGVVAAGVAAIWYLMDKSQSTRFWAPIFVADAAVVLLPHWITGTRRGWRPVALRQIVDALETAMSTIDRFETPPCQIQPMFAVAGQGERNVPTDARVFVRFPDGPGGLLGLQFQVALNNVQGTNYPYLYAVIVAQEDFGLLSGYLAKIRNHVGGSQAARKLTIESNREKDVEVIVIRQRTTKTSGYHTKAPAIRHIALAAWQSVEIVLAAQR